MVRIDNKRSISEEIDAKLSQCVLHGKDFLAMNWLIALSCLRLTRLIIDDGQYSDAI